MPNMLLRGPSEKLDFLPKPVLLLLLLLLLKPPNFFFVLELELTNGWLCFDLAEPSKDATNSSYTLAAASCFTAPAIRRVRPQQ